MMKTKSLYVHIPFCQHICNYCDFCKVFYQSELVDKYLVQLQKQLEILNIVEQLETIYIGGGTPSCLSCGQLETLFTMLDPYVSPTCIEYCIEVNPESMDNDKAKLFSKYGISRISIGVQTFHSQLLSEIERVHNKQQVIDVIDTLHDCGITNISIDMMYGLPNQTIDDVKNDLEIIKSLNIVHISYYSLILEKNTKLYNQKYKGINADREYAMQELVDNTLQGLGFDKYEVSNYAKENYTSKHNLAYWKYNNYYGIGAGATMKIDDEIIENSRNVFGYSKGLYNNHVIKNTLADIKFNHIMMSMRLLEGLDINEYNYRYNEDFLVEYKDVLNRLQAKQLIVLDDNFIRCTSETIYYLHDILMEFL